MLPYPKERPCLSSCLDTTVGSGAMTTPLYLAGTTGDFGGYCFKSRKPVTFSAYSSPGYFSISGHVRSLYYFICMLFVFHVIYIPV